MDTALNNGDFKLDGRGRPYSISGMNEILQRVLIRLSVKKGSFVYDVNLGSELYKLKGSNGNLKNQALLAVKDALSQMPEVTVNDIEITFDNSNDNIDLKVYLTAINNNGEVEISF